jgi:hypothetical protein
MIKIKTIADQHKIENQRLKWQISQHTNIPMVMYKNATCIDEKYLPTVQMLCAKCKKYDEREVTRKSELAKRRYMNKKRVLLGVEPLPKLQRVDKGVERKKKDVSLEQIVFQYKDKVKKGHIIGAVSKDNFCKVLIRYKEESIVKYAEVVPEHIFYKSLDEINEMVLDAQKRMR